MYILSVPEVPYENFVRRFQFSQLCKNVVKFQGDSLHNCQHLF